MSLLRFLLICVLYFYYKDAIVNTWVQMILKT